MKLFEMHSFHGQTWSGDDGVEYDVPKLVDWARRVTKVVDVLIADLVGGGGSDEPDDSPEFAARAALSDLNYPILVGRDRSGRLHVMDGRHRVHKAVNQKRDAVPAFIVNLDDLPESCRSR